MSLNRSNQRDAHHNFSGPRINLLLKPVFIIAGIIALTACNETRSEEISEPETNASIHARSNTALASRSLDNIEFNEFEKLYLSSAPMDNIWSTACRPLYIKLCQ